MRLFAALSLPPAAREAIGVWWVEACTLLPAREWRDIPGENWHLTLAFFGDVEGGDVDDLAEQLAECASQAPPLDLRLSDFGVFPRPARAQVFWIGVDDAGGRGLKGLAGCCRRAGFATVRKHGGKSEPFRGHITLARRRGPPDPIPMEVLAQMPQVPDITWSSGRLQLMRSVLHKDGARYQVMEEFELGETALREGENVR